MLVQHTAQLPERLIVNVHGPLHLLHKRPRNQRPSLCLRIIFQLRMLLDKRKKPSHCIAFNRDGFDQWSSFAARRRWSRCHMDGEDWTMSWTSGTCRGCTSSTRRKKGLARSSRNLMQMGRPMARTVSAVNQPNRRGRKRTRRKTRMERRP